MGSKNLDIDEACDFGQQHGSLVEAVELLEATHPGATLTTDGRRLLTMLEAAVALGVQLTQYNEGLQRVSRLQENGCGKHSPDRFTDLVAAYGAEHAPSSPPQALELQQLIHQAQAMYDRLCRALQPAELGSPIPMEAGEDDPTADFSDYALDEPPLPGNQPATDLDTTWADNDPDDWSPDDCRVNNDGDALRFYASLTADGEHWVNQWDDKHNELLVDDHTHVATIADVVDCLASLLCGDGEKVGLDNINPAIRALFAAEYPHLMEA